LNKKAERYEYDSLKMVIFILLSYLVPVVGIGFSLYILNDSDMKNYGSWVKPVATIALSIQTLFVSFGFLGWLAWEAP